MWGGVGRTWVGHTHTHDGATWYHTTGDGTTHVTQILCHMVMKVRYDQGRRVPRYRCESLWPLLFLFYSYYHYFFSFFYESKCTCKVQGVALRYSGKGTGCYGDAWWCGQTHRNPLIFVSLQLVPDCFVRMPVPYGCPLIYIYIYITVR